MPRNNLENKILFLKWFPYDKRNEAISSAIGASCYFVYSLNKRTLWNAPIRYFLQFFKTLSLLYQEKPDVILVTNPPIFASFPVALYCFTNKKRFVIDSHTGAFAKKWKFVEFMHKFLSKKALLTVATNPALEISYKNWGAKTFILGDLVFDIPKKNSLNLSGNFNIVVICSYDPDEPIKEILKTACELPNANFYLTGNHKRLSSKILELKPDNIKFTGFLPDQEYFDLLHACDAIMVLVNQDNTMQQGAYEAVSIRKPMILSNWKILKDTYKLGTVFVNNEQDSIKNGILKMIENYDLYKEQMHILFEERKKIWDQNCKALIGLINR